MAPRDAPWIEVSIPPTGGGVSDLDIYVGSRARALANTDYVLGHSLAGLRRAGLKVRVLEGFDPADTGRSAFLHVDLTTLPPPFLWVHRFYDRCINGKALTIARELYSTARLLRGDAHDGPVIVKTRLNHRGLPELRFAGARGLLARRGFGRRRAGRRALRERLCPPYQVFGSIDQVPDEVWSDPNRMVERFLPGSLELPVVKRRHEFCLDLSLDTRATFDSLLCDPAKATKVEFLREVPPAVVAVREQLGLDFGAIDFFETGDGVFVIDANKTTTLTPGWVREHPPLARYFEQVTERLVEFARGR